MVSRFEHFSSAIFCINRDIQKILRMEMAKYGLKGAYAQFLMALSHYPEGVTASRLCEICDKDKAAISRTMRELEEKKLVQRDEGGHGGYRSLLRLTEMGKNAAHEVEKRAKCAVAAAGNGLTEKQREMLYETLDLLASNLNMICQAGLN